MLLDASFVPVNCRGDRHRIPDFDVSEFLVTGDVKDVGSTWADVSGFVSLQSLRGYIPVNGFGIEYKKNVENSESVFSQASIYDLKDNTIIVRLEKLSPSTEYAYRVYVRYDFRYLYYGEYKTFKTKDK